ncbi:lactonase family protein [Streptomyces sp. NPDC048172]|uniref:lactonase family protein n=1 Tax=Streptomyces sp. NPDC048172 TaxID=3365505 RepID=UPI003715D491
MGGTDGEQRAFLGSFTSAGGHGITAVRVDPETGALSAPRHTDAVPDPSYLTLAPGGAYLYAVSETVPGAAAALATRGTEAPEPLGAPVPVDGDGPTHLALAAGRLFTADYVSGTVSALRVRADGALDAGAYTHTHKGSGPNAERQESPHAHAVVPDPSGRWLLSVDLGTDSVWTYDLRDAAAGPRPCGETALRPGSGPRHLAFRPGAPHRAYVVNELDSTVTTCRWDAEAGVLEPRGETRTLPLDAPGEGNFPSGLALSPDGRFAWAANRGDDSVAVLALEDGEGLPEFVTTVPCGGHWPRDLAVHPSGRWIYAANERSGDVTWFTVDPATGVPRAAGALDAPAVSNVVFG